MRPRRSVFCSTRRRRTSGRRRSTAGRTGRRRRSRIGMPRTRRRRLRPGRPGRRTRGTRRKRPRRGRGSRRSTRRSRRWRRSSGEPTRPHGETRPARREAEAAPCRGEAGRGEESPPNGARPPARGRGAAARKPGRPRSEVERGRQRRDDGREHRCGPRRRRVGRDASRPASRRAVGRGGRRPVPSGARHVRRAVRDGGSRRRRRDGRSTAEARLSREGAVRDAGRRRGARRSPRPPQPVLVAHGDADRHRARARCRRAAIGPAAGGDLGAPGGSRSGTAVPGCPGRSVAANGRGFGEFTETGRPARRLTRTLSDRARAVAIAAERPEPPAPPGLVKRLFEWVRERVREDCWAQASPVESGAPSGSFRGRRRRTGTRRRGRAGTGGAGPGRPVDRRGQDGRPAVGEHHPGHGNPHRRRGVDRRPAGDAGVTAGGPRADQLGDGALGRSLDRGCRIERPLPAVRRTRRPTSAIGRPSASGAPCRGGGAG